MSVEINEEHLNEDGGPPNFGLDSAPDDEYEEHCQHRSRTYDDEDWLYDPAEDFCVHCECCCTCLGCEYGPRDGQLMATYATPEQRARMEAMSNGVS